MLKIGICDDDRKILNQIEEMVENAIRGTKEKVDISQFISGEEFCERAELDLLDIIFLDIEMANMNGVKTAEYLRSLNTHAKLIYVSSYDNYFRQLFRVNTFGFLDKPIDEVKFNRLFHEACSEIRSYNDVFPYHSGKSVGRVLLREIMYFRSNAHTMNIHCLDGKEIKYYEKLSEVMEKVATVDFLQISKSYAVNLAHTKKLNMKEAIMVNDDILPISRSIREEVFKAYCRYMGRRSQR